jgi:glyoxylase-like metal-dependent hydrolase (beta-lactamase superfamily II)/8-oxo-dGTP pyrophosphatase MutT (NUDIX family)
VSTQGTAADATPGSPIPQAASVLLTPGPGSPEVYMVRRAPALRFFGGFFAFPGGKVAPSDAAAPFVGVHDPRHVAAVRELFEETGVLLARRPDGSPVSHEPAFATLRRELIAERVSFADVLHHYEATLHAADMGQVGDVTTPPFAATRFDTRFFVAHLPPGQQVELWPGELDAGRWTTADAMLAEWERGECLVSPPTVVILEAVRGRAADDAPARLGPLFNRVAAGALHPIFFARDVRMIPLRTEGLPPSTYTNAYLVGRDPAYLIDPGPTDPDEQARLFALLDDERAAGLRLAAVVLSHQHPDHIGAAAASAARSSVPVWAHELTARALAGRIGVQRFLHEGDRLDLGTAADGRPWHLDVLHTPGHAAGHLVFYEPHYRLLFAGDMVSTLSSVVIAPPEGDLAVYLESLRRLRTYPSRLLLPSHGSASADPVKTIDEWLAHRAKREEMLLTALSAGPRTVRELAPELYKGLPPGVMRFAALQILAGLRKLEREGRAEQVAGNGEPAWRLRPGAPIP